MPEANYGVGQKLRIHGDFTSGGTYRDPTVVTFVIRHGNDVVATHVYNPVDPANIIMRTAAGRYYVDWIFDKYGLWSWHWDSTGIVDAVVDASVHINRSKVLGSV